MTVALRDALDAVLDAVRANADEIEQQRRLPVAVVEALRDSGLNRVVIPAALGGTEAPVADVVDAVAAIGAVDGSAGWCAAIGAGSNVFAGYLPRAAAEEVFAEPDQANATMFAPTGTVDADGRLTGRWAFTSNCLHSTWVGLGSIVRRPDGAPEPAPRVVFVPLADMVIEDTWHSAGLRGTGSHHVRAEALPVSLLQSCRFSDAAWPEGTLWRLPIYTVLIPVLSSVPLGIARGAVDAVLGLAAEGRDAQRGQLHADAIGMGELARADTALRAAAALLKASLEEAHDLAARGEPVDRRLQARVMLATMHGCDVAVASTQVAHALGGAAAVFDASALLKALLDVQTARQHALFGHHHRAPLAAAVAGRDVVYPPFLP